MSQAAGGNLAIAPSTGLDKIQRICVMLVLLNQVLGLFAPPEAFLLDPQNYSGLGDTAANASLSYPITTMISRLVEALALLLVLRYWRAYLGLVTRSIPVFVQAALFALTTVWSIDQAESFRASLHLLLDCIFALEIVRSYSVLGLTRLLVRLFGVIALASFLMLILFPSVSHEFGDAGFGSDWRGAVATKNSLGATASIGVITCAYSFLVRANDRRFAMLVLLSNIVLVAGSRSATGFIVSVLCLAALLGWFATRSTSGKFVLVALGLGAVCIVGAALSSVDHPAALLGKSATLTGRTGVWQAVIPLIKDRLTTGYGIGFWVVDSDFRNDIWLSTGWKTPYAHNDVIDVLLQTGLLGVCVFIANYVLSFYLGLRRIFRFEEGYLFCLLIVVNFIVRGLAETVSLPPGDTGVALLYVAEIYLWTLRSPRRMPSAPARQRISKTMRPAMNEGMVR